MNKRYLIKIAKDAILEEFLQKSLIDRDKLLKTYPELGKKGAVFVTLEKRKSLRGCIGTLTAHQPLLDDLVHNAKLAAFRDTRFSPLNKEEFDDKNFTVEISLLTEPKRLDYKDASDLKKKIKAGEDGVILKYRGYQATFLPQVWEQLPRFDEFFAHLCNKAGLRVNCLDGHPDIYIYHVEKIKE
jgi:AmmeMemoRadiSam system protein A